MGNFVGCRHARIQNFKTVKMRISIPTYLFLLLITLQLVSSEEKKTTDDELEEAKRTIDQWLRGRFGKRETDQWLRGRFGKRDAEHEGAEQWLRGRFGKRDSAATASDDNEQWFRGRFGRELVDQWLRGRFGREMDQWLRGRFGRSSENGKSPNDVNESNSERKKSIEITNASVKRATK